MRTRERVCFFICGAKRVNSYTLFIIVASGARSVGCIEIVGECDLVDKRFDACEFSDVVTVGGQKTVAQIGMILFDAIDEFCAHRLRPFSASGK